jgi:hypothetical protein
MRERLLFIYILIFPLCLIGQDRVEKKVLPLKYSTVLKTNPLPILWGPILFTSEYRIINEFVVAPQQSTQIGLSYLGKTPILKLFDVLSNGGISQFNFIIRGFRFQFAHRIFLNQYLKWDDTDADIYAPEGFFVGPMFSYSTARVTNRFLNQYDIYRRITHWNLNLVGGYQLALLKNYTVEAFAGFGFKENKLYEYVNRQNIPINTDYLGEHYNSNFKIILGFNFGMAF